MKKLLIWPLAFSLVSCVESVDLTGAETDLTSVLNRAKVEFNPSAGIVPFPNNLLLTGGTPEAPLINIPEQCNESPTAQQLRESILNTLDGFGVYQYPIQFSLSEPVDAATIAENVVLVDLGVSPPAVIPTLAIPGTADRSLPDCVGTETIDNVTLIPGVGLSANTNYMVMIKRGLKAADGDDFGADWTWALIRGELQPVEFGYVDNVAADLDAGEWAPDGTQTKVVISNRTPLASSEENFESLEGLLLLWEAHKDILDVATQLGTQRDDVLLAWSFKTGSTTQSLDPAVDGSAADQALADVAGIRLKDYMGADEASAFVADHMNRYFGFNVFEEASDSPDNWKSDETTKIQYYCDDTQGDQAGYAMDCANLGGVMYAEFSSPQYQLPFDDRGVIAADGSVFEGAPGPWMDIIRPPQTTNIENIEALIVLPSTPAPEGGYPVVFYGHGVGNSKEQGFPIALALAGKGIATVGIDWVAQGVRAVKVPQPAADCGYVKDPDSGDVKRTSFNPESGCYYPLLANNPLVARDNARQSALDYQVFIKSLLGSCGDADGCSGFKVDTDKVGYLGLSIGGFIGQLTVAMSPEIKALALSNTGIGWIETVEKTNPFYACPLVNAGIDSGTLSGSYWDGPEDTDALCLNKDPADPASFVNAPGWGTLASAYRWTLDMAEPANFVGLTAARGLPTLIQMAEGDHTVPNDVSEKAGAAYAEGWAELGVQVAGFETAAIGADGHSTQIDTSNQVLLKYVDDESRQYEHESLMRPTPRRYCFHEGANSPCTQEDYDAFQHWVSGVKHYQADTAVFFEKHLNSADQ